MLIRIISGKKWSIPTVPCSLISLLPGAALAGWWFPSWQCHFQVTVGADSSVDAGDFGCSRQGEPCVSGGDHHDGGHQQHADCGHQLGFDIFLTACVCLVHNYYHNPFFSLRVSAPAGAMYPTGSGVRPPVKNNNLLALPSGEGGPRSGG